MTPGRLGDLQCPKCAARMDEESYRGLALDRCRACSGLWFDRKEIDQYVSSAGPRAKAQTTPGIPVPLTRGAADLLCPRCQKRTLGLYSWYGAKINQCSRCRGIFLEPEQLATIFERYVPSAKTPDPDTGDVIQYLLDALDLD